MINLAAIAQENPAFMALARQFDEFARRRGLPLRFSHMRRGGSVCVSYETEMLSKARLAALGEFIAEYERKPVVGR